MKEKGSSGRALIVSLMAFSTTSCRLNLSMYLRGAGGGAGGGRGLAGSPGRPAACAASRASPRRSLLGRHGCQASAAALGCAGEERSTRRARAQREHQLRGGGLQQCSSAPPTRCACPSHLPCRTRALPGPRLHCPSRGCARWGGGDHTPLACTLAHAGSACEAGRHAEGVQGTQSVHAKCSSGSSSDTRRDAAPPPPARPAAAPRTPDAAVPHARRLPHRLHPLPRGVGAPRSRAVPPRWGGGGGGRCLGGCWRVGGGGGGAAVCVGVRACGGGRSASVRHGDAQLPLPATPNPPPVAPAGLKSDMHGCAAGRSGWLFGWEGVVCGRQPPPNTHPCAHPSNPHPHPARPRVKGRRLASWSWWPRAN